jgi:hypothetical protein
MTAGMQNDPDPGLNSEPKPENFKPRTQTPARIQIFKNPEPKLEILVKNF